MNEWFFIYVIWLNILSSKLLVEFESARETCGIYERASFVTKPCWNLVPKQLHTLRQEWNKALIFLTEEV